MSQRPGRRAACPSLAQPMRTGDGWLVRLAPLRHELNGSVMVRLAELALQHGNGQLEITQRGNLQARGFTQASAAAFNMAVNQVLPQPLASPVVSLEPSPTESGKNTRWALASGVACRDPASSCPAGYLQELRESLLQAVAALELTLAPKCSVLVEGDGGWGMAELSADVRLRLNSRECALGIGGNVSTAVWYRPRALVQVDQVERKMDALVDAAIVVLKQLAAVEGMRGRELKQRQRLASSMAAAGWLPGPSPSLPRRPMPAIGQIAEQSLVLGVPFGVLEAADLKAIGQVCGHHEVVVWWLPGRRILLVGTQEALVDVRRLASQHGLITEPTDARLHMSACQGAPGCRSGWVAARQLATRLAASLEDGSKTVPGAYKGLHVAGCAKGCAAPNTRTRCLVGVGPDRLAVVRHGLAHDSPDAYIAVPAREALWQLIDVVEQH